MKLLNVNKLLSGLLSLGLLVNMTTPAFAYNSTGSNTDLDNIIGEDTVQNMYTEYSDHASDETSAQTDIYMTRSSTFTALIPKTIILSGTDGTGSYVVGAKGDVLTEDTIQIEPDSYELTLYKKNAPESTIEASITQPDTQIGGSAIEAMNGAYAMLEGQIEALELKAGSWSTKMSFNIRLIESDNYTEPSEPIEYQDFVVTRENRTKIGYTATKSNLAIPETFYDREDGVWYKVIGIDDYAFMNCTNLVSVELPGSINKISQFVFYNCANLKSITIPDSITEIGYNAFSECTSLTSITIPDSVISIGDLAFNNCFSLKSVTIGNSVTEIGNFAFWNCTNLSFITIPDSVITIGSHAFRDCTSLASVGIGNSVAVINEGAFSGCTALTAITIPNSVTKIGDWAFENCTSLIFLKMQNPTVEIGTNAFYNVPTVIRWEPPVED